MRVWGGLVASLFLQSSEVFYRPYMTTVFWFTLPLSYFSFMFKPAQTSVILVNISGPSSQNCCQGTCGCWDVCEGLRSIEADTELSWNKQFLQKVYGGISIVTLMFTSLVTEGH